MVVIRTSLQAIRSVKHARGRVFAGTCRLAQEVATSDPAAGSQWFPHTIVRCKHTHVPPAEMAKDFGRISLVALLAENRVSVSDVVALIFNPAAGSAPVRGGTSDTSGTPPQLHVSQLENIDEQLAAERAATTNGNADVETASGIAGRPTTTLAIAVSLLEQICRKHAQLMRSKHSSTPYDTVRDISHALLLELERILCPQIDSTGADTVARAAKAVSAAIRPFDIMSVRLMQSFSQWLELLHSEKPKANPDAVLDVALSTLLGLRNIHCTSRSCVLTLSIAVQQVHERKLTPARLRDVLVCLCSAPASSDYMKGIQRSLELAIACLATWSHRTPRDDDLFTQAFSGIHATCYLAKREQELLAPLLKSEWARIEPIWRTVVERSSGQRRLALYRQRAGMEMVFGLPKHTVPQPQDMQRCGLQSLHEKQVLSLLNTVSRVLNVAYPSTQYLTACGYTVDFAWPGEMVCLELDGPLHAEPRDFSEYIHNAMEPLPPAAAPSALLRNMTTTSSFPNAATRLRNTMLAAEGWHVLVLHTADIDHLRQDAPNAQMFKAQLLEQLQALLAPTLRKLWTES